ncbi:C40 family peptidase [Cellulomonas fimi]|uniref:C40 family peptidase n=1 Tax=Cellulomonas fimi TaxID=1708 RepID=UPI00234CBBF9|nr:C40 family peptidase [Cellulomonas fimi]
MPARSASSRHRAARRPRTALDDLVVRSTDSMNEAGRRSVAVAAASGLALGLAAAPTYANHPRESAQSIGGVDTDAATAAARALIGARVVTAPAEATWTFDAPVVTAVAPPPPPAPAPAETRATASSRSQERRAATPAAAPAAAAPAVEVPASASGSAVVEIAMRYIGVPYVSGGTTPAGFDCSGFTSYVYAQVGINLPRTSSQQRYAGTVVSRADAQPGDLIWSPGHVAIYAGGDMQVDSPRPGKTIQLREIWQSSPTFIRLG